jgi:hypothetical protein
MNKKALLNHGKFRFPGQKNHKKDKAKKRPCQVIEAQIAETIHKHIQPTGGSIAPGGVHKLMTLFR